MCAENSLVKAEQGAGSEVMWVAPLWVHGHTPIYFWKVHVTSIHIHCYLYTLQDMTNKVTAPKAVCFRKLLRREGKIRFYTQNRHLEALLRLGIT